MSDGGEWSDPMIVAEDSEVVIALLLQRFVNSI